MSKYLWMVLTVIFKWNRKDHRMILFLLLVRLLSIQLKTKTKFTQYKFNIIKIKFIDLITMFIILHLFDILSEFEQFLILNSWFDILTVSETSKELNIIRTKHNLTKQLCAFKLQKRGSIYLGETGRNSPWTQVLSI